MNELIKMVIKILNFSLSLTFNLLLLAYTHNHFGKHLATASINSFQLVIVSAEPVTHIHSVKIACLLIYCCIHFLMYSCSTT